MTKQVRFPFILHGGDYNPEQWPESVWDADIILMQAAHVNVATLSVFGWVRLQPDEETFDFGWLDRVIEKLTAGGISLCMATATASVPAWMDQKYPDILRVDQNGQKLRHGNRHSFCPHSPNFRRLSTSLVRRLAERYKDHPGLLLWHIGNEYGNYCYCDLCAAAFRAWLQERYGSLDEVNRRWYTAFWGHTFTDWSQIETPTLNGERSMQSLLVDYDRFQSDSLLGCFKAEADVLREITPNIPITTNLMGTFKPLDYHAWAREMDLVSWDSYPMRSEAPAQIAFKHALMRGLKDGQPFLLMEQTPSQTNWQPYNGLKRPGVMRLLSYQAMAHGADSVMYFQWRRGRGAMEKFHGAVVEHAGRGDTRVFREVSELGKELESLGERTLGGRVPARVAILFDWDNWHALEYSSGLTIDLKYAEQCVAYYSALHALNIPTDVVSVEANFSQYDVIIAPVLYMVKPGVAEKLEQWTYDGGTFVTTYFSGLVDETDLIVTGGYPAPFRNLLGIWVEEIDALMPNETNEISFSAAAAPLKGTYRCGLICDRVHAEEATVLATFGKDFYVGEPAITRNEFGDGRAYYVASQLQPDGLKAFIAQICRDEWLEPPLAGIPEGVEVVPRVSPSGETLLYVLNHNPQRVSVPLGSEPRRDLLTEAPASGVLELPGHGVAILGPGSS